MDQRTVGNTFFETGTDLEFGNFLGELLGKFVVDGFVDVDPVGTDTSLTGASELGSDGTGNGGGDVGVFKDDERSVATKLERHLLEGRRALRSKNLADSGGTREGDLVNSRVGTEFFTDILEVGVGGDDVDDTVRDAGSSGKLQEWF